ncbi:MAG: hypothetical protein WC505_07300 [Patescibacteria group bacterium]
MKRFTETAKWNSSWFRKLSPEFKCFWQYICDTCDAAGVWDVDIALAEFVIGCHLDGALDAFNSSPAEQRIFVFDGGTKWLITKFIRFQYGSLSNDCKPHKKVIKLIEKHGVEAIIYQKKQRVSIPYTKKAKMVPPSSPPYISPSSSPGFPSNSNKSLNNYLSTNYKGARGTEKVFKKFAEGKEVGRREIATKIRERVPKTDMERREFCDSLGLDGDLRERTWAILCILARRRTDIKNPGGYMYRELGAVHQPSDWAIAQAKREMAEKPLFSCPSAVTGAATIQAKKAKARENLRRRAKKSEAR